jgi:hypothetical protein
MNTATIGSHHWPTSVWRKLMWSGAIALLLAPGIGMQFSTEVNWTPVDFIVFGTMLAIAGGIVEIAARASRDQAYLIATVIAVGAGFLMVWANLAVGIIGSENNPANLIFFGVLGVGVLGALIARLRAAGMARALQATALAQFAAAITAAAVGWGQVWVFTAIYIALWLSSARLYANAAEREARFNHPDREGV